MSYCPNCQNQLEPDTLSCGSCGADFGPGSAWKPTKTAKKRHESGMQEAIKQPTAVNALFAGMTFPLLAPGIGAMFFVFADNTRAPMFMIAVFFTLIGAYSFAAVPAAIAGAAYSLMALLAVSTLKLARLSYPLVATFGCVSGIVGMAVKHRAVSGVFVPQTAGIAYMFLLAAIAGAILAIFTSWLAPIGSKPATPVPRDA